MAGERPDKREKMAVPLFMPHGLTPILLFHNSQPFNLSLGLILLNVRRLEVKNHDNRNALYIINFTRMLFTDTIGKDCPWSPSLSDKRNMRAAIEICPKYDSTHLMLTKPFFDPKNE